MAEPQITYEVKRLDGSDTLGDFDVLEQAQAALEQANAEEELYVLSEKHTYPAAE